MNTHEDKYCPRCHNSFECKVDDIAHCLCSSVNMSEETKQFLKSTSYKDCLCSKCLVEINDKVAWLSVHSFPKDSTAMIEGLHYYIDNGYFVFTELYHMQRGYCCKNNCRHCAYGNKKQ